MLNPNNEPRKETSTVPTRHVRVCGDPTVVRTSPKSQASQLMANHTATEHPAVLETSESTNLGQALKVLAVSAVGALAALGATHALIGSKALALPTGAIIGGALLPLLVSSKLPVPLRCVLGVGFGLISHYAWTALFRNYF